MSLIQACALVLLLRRPHGIDLDGPNRGNWPTSGHIAEKYGGAETVYVSDSRALYHMVVKDQPSSKSPTPSSCQSNKLVFGEGLISTVAHKEIDILPRLSRCALDGVCQGILGYPSDTLSAAENDAYPEALRKIGKVLDLVMVPWLPTQFMADVREMRRIVETTDSASRKAFSEKKAAMEAEETPDPVGAVCRDGDSVTSMMDIMLKANAMSSDTERLTDAELLGQMNVMVFASLDTTTSALARCVYLLAQHSGAQTRLRSEIRDAMKTLEEDGDMSSAELPYDVLMNLPFLDDIVKEALRLYPSLPVMARVTSKATTLPLQFPTRSRFGGYTSAVAIPEGTFTIISVPRDWRPERWLSYPLVAPSQAHEAYIPLGKEFLRVKDSARFPVLAALSPTQIHLCVPNAHMMAFLGGFKFAKMGSKQVLATLVLCTLVLCLHFLLSTEQNAQVHVKEIQWKLQAFHIPVVKPPAGDGVTPQVPLNVRLVKKNGFIW
ncbi:cytochrome P450 [Suillus lakei]|nr:cytochrome P450 [Suillus lakei]